MNRRRVGRFKSLGQRIVFVLVSGTLVHETYDYIDDYGQLTSVDRVFIEKDSAKRL